MKEIFLRRSIRKYTDKEISNIDLKKNFKSRNECTNCKKSQTI